MLLPRSPASDGPSAVVSASDRRRAIAIVAALVVVNVSAVMLLTVAVGRYPSLSAGATLAYTFGLRHAVDADHIAAIDNVTRKLSSAPAPGTVGAAARRPAPLLVGLFFSLGHSTVVGLMCLGVALGSTYLSDNVTSLKESLAPIGTLVSVSVLLLVSGLNIATARRLYHDYHERRATGEHRHYSAFGATFFTHTHAVEVDEFAEVKPSGATSGLLARCCPGIFRGITAEWHMYPVGLLFGLGFDTASEIALLGLTAMSSDSGVPPLLTLLLPLLFACAMSLVDTLDGMMMLFMYRWAGGDPARRLFFNLFLTALSAAIALVVAAVELLGQVQDKLHLAGPFWDGVKSVNDHFEYVGYSIIALFVLSCGGAAAYMRLSLGGGECGGGGEEAEAEEMAAAQEKARQEGDYLRRRMLALATGAAKAREIDV
uniref:Nickel/cobalt efflux system n=1 Tax=Emiliania huxleyi TaxID=2903 RepID=A0A7S3TRG6_EMIHU|mmetsp:Transcript_2458/g.7307  ORF Transcript_2458/g.7307 Transcript_2458/m.7307 type:complete len:429 (-) Transcript_2458:73-1359(-)